MGRKKKEKVTQPEQPIKMVSTSRNKMIEKVPDKVINNPEPMKIIKVKVRMMANACTPLMDYAAGKIYLVSKKEYESIKLSCVIEK